MRPYLLVLLLSGLLNTSIIGFNNTVCAEEDTEVPEFTKENIFKYRNDKKNQKVLTDYAKKHIATQDRNEIETIIYMMEQWRNGCRQPNAAKELLSAMLDTTHFSQVNEDILKTFLRFNNDSTDIDSLVKVLLSTDNSHVQTAWENKWMVLNDLDDSHSGGYYLSHYIIEATINDPASVATNNMLLIFNKIYQDRPFSEDKKCLRLFNAIIKNFNNLAPEIIQCIYNRLDSSWHYGHQHLLRVLREMTEQRFKHTVNQLHAHQLIDIYKNRKWSPVPHCAVSIQRISTAIIRDFATISPEDFDYIYDNYIIGDERKQFKKLVKQHYEPLLNQLHANDLIEIHQRRCNESPAINSIEIKKPIPNCAISKNRIIVATIRDIDTVEPKNLDYILDDHRDNPWTDYWRHNIEIKKKLNRLVEQRFAERLCALSKKNIIDVISNNEVPQFTKLLQCTQHNHDPIQTDKHICANTDRIKHFMIAHAMQLSNINMVNLIRNAREKEKEEITKGNHVFYHGQHWRWNLIADMYKMAYNITAPAEDRVGDDYQFLRFDSLPAGISVHENFLYANCALFGNSADSGRCILNYVMNEDNSDHSNIHDGFTPEKLFASCGLVYDPKYKDDFEKLAQLHQEANSNHCGNLLMLSVADDKVNKVNLMDGKADTKKLLETLRTEPLKIRDSDGLVFVLPLTKDYALDPKKGPKIYAFNACDPVKYKEYETFRDSLSAKIKTSLLQKKT